MEEPVLGEFEEEEEKEESGDLRSQSLMVHGARIGDENVASKVNTGQAHVGS